MQARRRYLWLLTVVSLVLVAAATLSAYAQEGVFPLTNTDGLRVHRVLAVATDYEGRRAVNIREDPKTPGTGADRLAIIDATEFGDGTIEVELAGMPAVGAGAEARGFVGIAFRVAADASSFECIYLRPTNGRAEDQLRRNRSVQYESIPDFPWNRLRTETPGQYESYADLVPGMWTKVKIQVSGTKARLYLHGAEQPNLIVNDLKLGEASGMLALWIGPGTDAYFSNLRVTR